MRFMMIVGQCKHTYYAPRPTNSVLLHLAVIYFLCKNDKFPIEESYYEETVAICPGLAKNCMSADWPICRTLVVHTHSSRILTQAKLVK